MTINRVKRYIAAELLLESCQFIQRAIKYQWRAANVFRDGLTEKEREILQKRQTALQRYSEDIYKMQRRLRDTGRCT